jgi:hypothetical protein
MNIYEEYFKKYKDLLEKRFPFRLRNQPWMYVQQCLIVFGAFILVLFILLKTMKFRRSYKEVAGWDVTLAACLLNLLFAYGFGFVAVLNAWWFFFPDLDTGILWRIGKGQMTLGDVVFYVLATVMGQLAVIITARCSTGAIADPKRDSLLKLLWFSIVFIVTVFGLPFGSQVMRGMILWLYLPFGLMGLLFLRRYSAVQLWFPTMVFVVCEFIWDAVSRITGTWIFPDAATHPGLYFTEITLFHAGKYPIVWQPEMTQMAFISGMVCLVFFLTARTFLRNDPIA